ncbi:MAG: HEAT repeat domain-containing protein [Planctomycetota bacterium]
MKKNICFFIIVFCVLLFVSFNVKCASEGLTRRIFEIEKQNQVMTKQIKEISDSVSDDKKTLEYIRFELKILREEIMQSERQKNGSSVSEQITKLVKDLESETANITEISARLRLFGKASVAALVETMHTTNIRYRTRIEESLSLMTTYEAVPILSIAIKEKDIRISVVHILGNLQDISALPILAEMITDPDKSFTFAVGEALIKLKDKRGIPIMIEALKSDESSHRALAISLLAKLNAGETFEYKHYSAVKEQQEPIDKWNTWWLKESSGFQFP